MTTDTQEADRKRRRSAAEIRELFERTDVEQTVDTTDGAVLLGVRAQTMRRWACEGSGPLRPRKLNGRLRWSVAEIRAVLSGSAIPA